MSQDTAPFLMAEASLPPIVQDFDLFLDALDQPSHFLTKAKQTLDRATLHSLDSRMRTFQSSPGPKVDQDRYPLLNFFQVACLAARLHAVDPAAAKPRMKPTDNLAEFRKLTPTERYMALLEALWVDCDWVDLHLPSRRMDNGFLAATTLSKLARLLGVKSGLSVFDNLAQTLGLKKDPLEWGLGETSNPIILVLSFFGLLDCALDSAAGNAWLKGQITVKSASPTPAGSAILPVLIRERPLHVWNQFLRAEQGLPLAKFPGQGAEAGDGGVNEPTPFFQAFLPFFPAGSLKAGLPRPAPVHRKGTFVFKVSRGQQLSRTLALSDRHTFDDLHVAIQEAVEFDDDHLYCFYLDGKPGSRLALNDPRSEEPPFADQVELGDSGLALGQRLLYLFDFGDNWEFEVQLLEIRDEPHKDRPKIIEKKGNSPDQYRRGW